MLRRLKASAPYRLLEQYTEDQAPLLAITIAWTGLLTMFPLVLSLVAIVGLVVRDPQVMAAVAATFVEILPEDTAAEADDVLRELSEPAGTLGLIGLGGLLFGGSALFGSMATAFNTVYHVPGRGIVGQRLMGMAMVLLFSVLLVASITASGLAGALIAEAEGLLPFDVPGWGMMGTAAGWGISLLTAMLMFLTIYRIVPNAGQRLSEIWPGTLVAAILFFLLIQSFPLYARYFAAFGRYAIFGLFFLLMMWFYFLAQILVLGAVLNAFIYRPEAHVSLLPGAGSERESEPDGEERQAGGNLVKRLLFAALSLVVGWTMALLTRVFARPLQERVEVRFRR